jgi:hypothetical protein
MKFGSKAVTVETVIFVIAAIVVVFILLYMLVFRGANPFAQQTDFTKCLGELNSACGAGYINTGATKNVEDACKYVSGVFTDCITCINTGCSPDQNPTTFQSCCNWARGQQQG